MKIGFTGTRRGMTEQQQSTVARWLEVYRPIVFVHGGAIGADDQADALAASFFIKRFVYPSTLVYQSVPAHTLEQRNSEVRFAPPAPPLQRNRAIVDNVELLIAAPGEARIIMRSGTWATVRYARSIKRECVIVLPNGTTV